MKETLIFVLEEELKKKGEIAELRKKLSSLEAEEASIKAMTSSVEEEEIKEQLTSVRTELAKWVEIEKITSTDTSAKNVKSEIKKRKERLKDLETQDKSFIRLSEITKEREKLFEQYKSLAKSFTEACKAEREAYEANKEENELLVSTIKSELEKLTSTASNYTVVLKDTEAENEVVVEDLEETEELEEVENSEDVEVVEAEEENFFAPLDILYNFMKKFEELYIAASKDSDFDESGYLSGYEFLFDRISISNKDATLFVEAVESEEPFMGLTENQKKSLLWSLPKTFLKKVGLFDIINDRGTKNKDYVEGALNKFRPKFTFGFVVNLMTVLKSADDNDIVEFFYSNTDTYEKTSRFGFPKPVEKALVKVS